MNLKASSEIVYLNYYILFNQSVQIKYWQQNIFDFLPM